MRKRDIALQAVTIVLAFGVGILLGARTCGSPDVEREVVTQTVVQSGPERIVYQCPPDAGVQPDATSAAKTRKVDAVKVDREKGLPDAPKPISPRERQRLLAWVRDQSADLDGCRTSSKETYRLAVTLELDDEGGVKQVRLNAPPSEVPANVRRCLVDRMTRWKPPTEFVKDRRELVFGLTL